MKYSYDIVFSKRKSVSIVVSADNKITLRCPVDMSRERAERFLNEKSGWINKALKKNELKKQLNNDVISYEKIYVNGHKLPLITGCPKRLITDEGVFVKDIKDLKKLFLATFLNEFIDELDKIASKYGLKYSSVAVKSYKSRWGCCDGKNNLSFNYKIFMLPEHIRLYVIIHELCHTVHHNHSKNFWNLVGEFFPDYKSIKKQLTNYDFLTTLY